MKELARIAQKVYFFGITIYVVGGLLLQGATGHGFYFGSEDIMIFSLLSASVVLLYAFNKTKKLGLKNILGIILLITLVGVLILNIYFIRFNVSFKFDSVTSAVFFHFLSLLFLAIICLNIYSVFSNMKFG